MYTHYRRVLIILCTAVVWVKHFSFNICPYADKMFVTLRYMYTTRNSYIPIMYYVPYLFPVVKTSTVILRILYYAFLRFISV